MDLDGMGKDVRTLKSALQRMESVISFVEGLKAAGFDPSRFAPGGSAVVALTDDQKAQVRDQFAEIIKPISQAIDLKLNSFDDRLKQIEGGGVAGSAADMSQRLTALEQVKSDGDEQYDRLEQMLTWFDANKEGLELLLSFDAEVDPPSPQPELVLGTRPETLLGTAENGNPQTGAPTAHGLAPGATETASGGGSTVSGTDGSGTVDGAHEGSFKGMSEHADQLGETGNTPGSGGPVGEAAGGPLQGDPATAADQKVKEPVAGRNQGQEA